MVKYLLFVLSNEGLFSCIWHIPILVNALKQNDCLDILGTLKFFET